MLGIVDADSGMYTIAIGSFFLTSQGTVNVIVYSNFEAMTLLSKLCCSRESYMRNIWHSSYHPSSHFPSRSQSEYQSTREKSHLEDAETARVNRTQDSHSVAVNDHYLPKPNALVHIKTDGNAQGTTSLVVVVEDDVDDQIGAKDIFDDDFDNAE